MNDSTQGGDWREYSRLVLSELERNARVAEQINAEVVKLRVEEMSRIRTEISLLKFQAALWGTVGGLVFTTVLALGSRFIK
jgi:hypothetical protein